MTEEIASIQAPWEMPEMKRPVFKDLKNSIVETAAKSEKMVTKAILKAIDEVSRKGGGKGSGTSRSLENRSYRVKE